MQLYNLEYIKIIYEKVKVLSKALLKTSKKI